MTIQIRTLRRPDLPATPGFPRIHYRADLRSPVYSPRDQFVMRKSLDMDQQRDRLAGNRDYPIEARRPDKNTRLRTRRVRVRGHSFVLRH